MIREVPMGARMVNYLTFVLYLMSSEYKEYYVDGFKDRSKRWNRQPSTTAHNKSIKTYDILGKTNSKEHRDLNLRKFTIPKPPAGLRNNASRIPIYSNNTIKIPFLSQLNLLPNIYLFLTVCIAL